LLVFVRGRRIGFEMKYADAPRMTKSMAIALQDLKLDRLLIVYPGDVSYPLRPGVEVVAIRDLEARLGALWRSPRRAPRRAR